MIALNRFLRLASGRQDFVFAALFVAVVAMLIIPLPTWLVDILLAVNLTISLLVLLTAIYLRNALEISTFPSIILITSIFRVALSVSTTRLILGQGDAGHLVAGFGNFVIAGNVVVGLVVFLIIAIVQFIVVTKGAERISEVGARFALDGMAGRQMAIDADLRNGDITKEEAKHRRAELQRELDFHSSMDGAMKFVKGDAIASIVIVFVNLIGGLIIGMVQRGMSFGDAGRLYTLLSVGDGLISQIPAMFIALAAGIIVTRTTDEESVNLGTDVSRQIFAQPKAIGICGVVAAAMGLLPGFPTTIFFAIAAICGVSAFVLGRAAPQRSGIQPEAQRDLPADPASAAPAEAADEAAIPLRDSQPGDVLVLRGRPDFLPLLGYPRVFAPIAAARESFTRRFGFESPSLGFIADTRVDFGHLIADIDDVPTSRLVLADLVPAQGLTPGHVQEVGDFIDQLWTAHPSQLFGPETAQTWLSGLEPTLGRLTADVQQALPFMILVDVLRKLLDEGIGLTPPRLVLEGIINAVPRSQDPDMIADLTRAMLRRQICHRYAREGRRLDALLLSPAFDDALQAMRAGKAADDKMIGVFVGRLREMLAGLQGKARPVLITGGDVRRTVRRLLVEQDIDVPVLGFNEVTRDFEVTNLGIVDVQPARAA
jgi:type III secretion protein V